MYKIKKDMVLGVLRISLMELSLKYFFELGMEYLKVKNCGHVCFSKYSPRECCQCQHKDGAKNMLCAICKERDEKII